MIGDEVVSRVFGSREEFCQSGLFLVAKGFEHLSCRTPGSVVVITYVCCELKQAKGGEPRVSPHTASDQGRYPRPSFGTARPANSIPEPAVRMGACTPDWSVQTQVRD